MGLFDKLKGIFKKKEDELKIENVIPQTPNRAYSFDSLKDFESFETKDDETSQNSHKTLNKASVGSVDESVQQLQTPLTRSVESVDSQSNTSYEQKNTNDSHEHYKSWEIKPPTQYKHEITQPKQKEVIKTEEKVIEEVQKANLTTEAIKQWEDTMRAAQQHPLSQVKIINTQILEELNAVLKSMDIKLNKLDDLGKLDKILELLLSTREDLSSKGMKSPFLDEAMKYIDQLTIKDKEVLQWIERQERVTASQLADYINLSRSTASFRLNRLEELGTLDKEAIGKKIYYKIKKGDNNSSFNKSESSNAENNSTEIDDNR